MDVEKVRAWLDECEKEAPEEGYQKTCKLIDVARAVMGEVMNHSADCDPIYFRKCPLCKALTALVEDSK